MICLRPSHYRRIAELEGKLAAAEARVKDLLTQVDALEEHKKQLMDWLLSLSGAPTLYGHEAPPRPEAPRSRPDPFANVTQGRDYRRVAEMLEAEAIAASNAAFKNHTS